MTRKEKRQQRLADRELGGGGGGATGPIISLAPTPKNAKRLIRVQRETVGSFKIGKRSLQWKGTDGQQAGLQLEGN